MNRCLPLVFSLASLCWIPSQARAQRYPETVESSVQMSSTPPDAIVFCELFYLDKDIDKLTITQGPKRSVSIRPPAPTAGRWQMPVDLRLGSSLRFRGNEARQTMECTVTAQGYETAKRTGYVSDFNGHHFDLVPTEARATGDGEGYALGELVIIVEKSGPRQGQMQVGTAVDVMHHRNFWMKDGVLVVAKKDQPAPEGAALSLDPHNEQWLALDNGKEVLVFRKKDITVTKFSGDGGQDR